MKKLFFLSALIFSFVSSFAGPVKPVKACYDDAVIPSYARCFYVTFTAVCCDGVTRSGYMGSHVASGTPSDAGLRDLIAMQIGCIPNNVTLKIDSNIALADYKLMFNGKYGKVSLNKQK